MGFGGQSWAQSQEGALGYTMEILAEGDVEAVGMPIGVDSISA